MLTESDNSNLKISIIVPLLSQTLQKLVPFPCKYTHFSLNGLVLISRKQSNERIALVRWKMKVFWSKAEKWSAKWKLEELTQKDTSKAGMQWHAVMEKIWIVVKTNRTEAEFLYWWYCLMRCQEITLRFWESMMSAVM